MSVQAHPPSRSAKPSLKYVPDLCQMHWGQIRGDLIGDGRCLSFLCATCCVQCASFILPRHSDLPYKLQRSLTSEPSALSSYHSLANNGWGRWSAQVDLSSLLRDTTPISPTPTSWSSTLSISKRGYRICCRRGVFELSSLAAPAVCYRV